LEGETTVTWSAPGASYFEFYQLDIHRTGEGVIRSEDLTETRYHAMNLQVAEKEASYRFQVSACRYINGERKCGAASQFSPIFRSGHLPSPPASVTPLESVSTDGRYRVEILPKNLSPSTLQAEEAADSEFNRIFRTALPIVQECVTMEEPGNDGEGLPTFETCTAYIDVSNAGSGQKWYRVRRCTAFGCSDRKETTTSVDVRKAPGAPVLSAPSTSSTTSYIITWEEPSSGTADSYRLYELTSIG